METVCFNILASFVVCV